MLTPPLQASLICYLVSMSMLLAQLYILLSATLSFKCICHECFVCISETFFRKFTALQKSSSVKLVNNWGTCARAACVRERERERNSTIKWVELDLFNTIWLGCKLGLDAFSMTLTFHQFWTYLSSILKMID